MTEENQCAVASGLASAFACDALFDQAAAEIGVDQATIGLIDGCDKRRVADPFPGRKFGEPAVLVNAGLLLFGHGLIRVYHA